MSAADNTSPQILFVDDEEIAVKYFKRAMESLVPVVTASSVEEGKRMLDEYVHSLLVLVTDQRMPGGYGNELLHYARLNYPHIVRILTTAYSELDDTVEAVNQGQIHRYIHKPWNISALRMELKQALDYAALLKEHTQLRQEKLLVRKKQTLSNRIGAVYALCVSLLPQEDLLPLESYLTAAATAGINADEPDWMTQDYAEMVSAEARRNGQFGHDLHKALGELKQANQAGADGLKRLAQTLGDRMQLAADGSVLFKDSKFFSEFLEAPSHIPVSQQHVDWLAFLLWLHGAGCSLQLLNTDAGMQCRLEQSSRQLSSVRLAEWVETFCEMGEGETLAAAQQAGPDN